MESEGSAATATARAGAGAAPESERRRRRAPPPPPRRWRRAPPKGQIVKTDTTNILIRSLQISKQKSEANDAKAAERGKGKRSGARNSDGRSPAKRANTGAAVASSRQEQTLQSMTVERLRALLKEKGLSTRGKKDELITRLMNEGA
uniref:SAP domain-containing protein n=1 Tax=Ananas comosus var. bracteatus TaxID=296719 RepID=A0A6V7Q0Y8_ANACO|nr:unnamed protein product [Ananas comosus var. bracteatus]